MISIFRFQNRYSPKARKGWTPLWRPKLGQISFGMSIATSAPPGADQSQIFKAWNFVEITQDGNVLVFCGKRFEQDTRSRLRKWSRRRPKACNLLALHSKHNDESLVEPISSSCVHHKAWFASEVMNAHRGRAVCLEGGVESNLFRSCYLLQAPPRTFRVRISFVSLIFCFFFALDLSPMLWFKQRWGSCVLYDRFFTDQ